LWYWLGHWLALEMDELRVEDLNIFLEPGMYVRHPSQPDWGIGQVQSRINGKITVNFTEVGKLVIDGSRVSLQQVIAND